MGHENQPTVNIEELARQNPKAGDTLAASLYAQNSAEGASPKPNLSEAQNILDRTIDKSGPLKIDGAQSPGGDKGGNPQAGPLSDRELMQKIREAYRNYHESHPDLPVRELPPPVQNPFTPRPNGQNNRPADAPKPTTPTIDEARQARQKKLDKKPKEIDTSNGEDADDTKTHSEQMANLKKLAKDMGIPLVVCITRSDDAADDLPAPKKAAGKTQAKRSTEMTKIMGELAQTEWGNVLVVQMEACPAAETIAKNQLGWTLGKEGQNQNPRQNSGLVVAPQVMVLQPGGKPIVKKYPVTLADITQLVHSK